MTMPPPFPLEASRPRGLAALRDDFREMLRQVQHGIGWNSPAALIYRFGTDEQKARYLPPLAKGEIMGAVAMTEPQAGSDVGALRTKA